MPSHGHGAYLGETYTFPEATGHILLNLGEGLTNESGAMVRRVSATEIEGTKLLGTFCYNAQKVFPVYFVLRVSKTPACFGGYWKKQRADDGRGGGVDAGQREV